MVSYKRYKIRNFENEILDAEILIDLTINKIGKESTLVKTQKSCIELAMALDSIEEMKSLKDGVKKEPVRQTLKLLCN